MIDHDLQPDVATPQPIDLALTLLRSYRQLTGRDLLPQAYSAVQAARDLYRAPFVVLAHDAAADPIFTYANLMAQEIFAMPWPELVGLPSRYSAEPMLRDARQRLLERVARDGYIDDYQGVRISRTGKRFMVRKATVWNLNDANGALVGQAATFAAWEALA